MRELPFNSQTEYVKNIINQLIKIFHDDQFSTEDIMSPLFRHSVGYVYRIDIPKVLEHLAEIGEIIILKKDNIRYDNQWKCGIIEFKVTEKFGKIPEVKIDVPLTDHIISSFDNELPKMMRAYALIASFENKLRFFISSFLENNKGSDWWETSVPNTVKRNIKDHRFQNWHIQLPKSEIQYTDFPDLIKIITKNWDIFEEVFKDQNSVKTYLGHLEIPRNTIAHSNVLSESMFQELELYSSKILNLIDQFND